MAKIIKSTKYIISSTLLIIMKLRLAVSFMFFRVRPRCLILFKLSAIISSLTYGVELWGCAYYNKYFSQTDKLVGRARKYGYILQKLFYKRYYSS